MQIVFRPEARTEALEAQEWYEERVSGLGQEFARALETAVQSAFRSPSAFRKTESGCRQVPMRRFPYSVIFRPGPEGILVVAVFHHRRHPATWTNRTED